jgi:DNA-binding PadR family transcriptional regulator
MTSSRKTSNPLALAVLVLLFEKPMHPYEMALTMRARGKEQSIKLRYGSLYTVIAMLVRQGLIVARETSREGRRPERTVYAITDSGEQEMRRWLGDLLERPEKEYLQFEAGLSLMPALPPDEVAVLLRERSAALDIRASALRFQLDQAHQAGLDPLFTVEGAYELALLDAERAFVLKIVASIEGGKLGATFGWKKLHDQRQRPASGKKLKTKTTAKSPSQKSGKKT